LALATKMVDVVEHYNLDVLHVHYAMPFAASAYLARQLMLPRQLGVVTTLHGTDITVVGWSRRSSGSLSSASRRADEYGGEPLPQGARSHRSASSADRGDL
jgi:hypothetical protein